MQVILDEYGFVKGYTLIGAFGVDSIMTNEPEDLEDFTTNYHSYYLSEDNILMKSVEKQLEIEDNRALADLRSQREKICYPYINRGELWYSRLTDEQKEELDTWYQAWLDVTDTKIVPEAPDWLS